MATILLFCLFFFFQSVFVLLYTKIKKNVERVHFLFPLPSVIYSKNAITWLFFFAISFVSIATGHGFKYL